MYILTPRVLQFWNTVSSISPNFETSYVLRNKNSGTVFPMDPKCTWTPNSPTLIRCFFWNCFESTLSRGSRRGHASAFLIALHLIAVHLSCLGSQTHEITVLCLLCRTTQPLQPLDRSFFKPLKTCYNQEAIVSTRNHKKRNITPYQVVELTGKAWGNATSVSQGSLMLKVTGTFCFNANVFPGHLSIARNVATPRVEIEPHIHVE
jgi:hypothetical protein